RYADIILYGSHITITTINISISNHGYMRSRHLVWQVGERIRHTTEFGGNRRIFIPVLYGRIKMVNSSCAREAAGHGVGSLVVVKPPVEIGIGRPKILPAYTGMSRIILKLQGKPAYRSRYFRIDEQVAIENRYLGDDLKVAVYSGRISINAVECGYR